MRHSSPTPLGIEARSHAGHRRFGWQRQSSGPVPPHPLPSPQRRGSHAGRAANLRVLLDLRESGWVSPSPLGRGWGEGERGLRPCHSGRSSVPDILQTRFQFLAALDIQVPPRRPSSQGNAALRCLTEYSSVAWRTRLALGARFAGLGRCDSRDRRRFPRVFRRRQLARPGRRRRGRGR